MNDITRAQFLKLLLGAAALAPGLSALGRDLDTMRGERVGWARLKTSSPIWKRHAGSDPKLMQFFRDNSTLNIDPTWYAADVEKLEEMCNYPLLFSQDIRVAQNGNAGGNLAEYIRRGGFLIVDACINPHTRGDPDVFIAEHTSAITQILPEASVTLLPDNHEIYRCFFEFSAGPPHTEDGDGWGNHGLYAASIGSRMAGIVSTSGLQCGWAGMKQVQGHDILCMEMLVNIYILAMMQGA